MTTTTTTGTKLFVIPVSRARIHTLYEIVSMFVPCILTALLLLLVHFIQSFCSLFSVCAFIAVVLMNQTKMSTSLTIAMLNFSVWKKEGKKCSRLDNLIEYETHTQFVCRYVRLVFHCFFALFLSIRLMRSAFFFYSTRIVIALAFCVHLF